MNRRNRTGTRLTVATEDFRGSVLVRDDGRVDGPAIVLVHGFCGSASWYDLVVARLADTFRIIRVDLLGHGGTGGGPADAPLQAQVLEGVLERLAVRKATVVGHSFGADVAVELAERSKRIERIAIACQAPDYSDVAFPRGNELMTLPLVGAALHTAARVASRGLSAALRLRPPADPAARLLVDQGLSDFRALDTGMFRVILDDRRARLARRPLDVQARETGKPLFVVLGGKDHFYGARCAARYEAIGAQVEILPDSGHSPLVDAPDAVARLLRAFCTEASAAGRPG